METNVEGEAAFAHNIVEVECVAGIALMP